MLKLGTLNKILLIAILLGFLLCITSILVTCLKINSFTGQGIYKQVIIEFNKSVKPFKPLLNSIENLTGTP